MHLRRPCLLLLLGAVLPAAAPAGAQQAPAGFDLPAEILALRDVDVPAEVAGVVTERPEDETAAVKAGDVVVALDDSFLAALAAAARAKVEGAKARREWAQIEHDRVSTLFASGSVNKADLERVQLSLREAVAALAAAEATSLEAERRLERTRIRAPFDGRLVRVPPERGEYLQIGATAFRLVDDSSFRIIAYVPPELVARFAVGQRVRVVAEPGVEGRKAFEAEVFSVASAAESKARTFRLEARAPRPAGQWRPGMTARLQPAAPAAKPTGRSEDPRRRGDASEEKSAPGGGR